jgi:uncharacterized YigZ family protein
MNPDRYHTLAGESEAVHREKASKFLAWAFPLANEAVFRSHLEGIARTHRSASHACYAWILEVDGSRSRANDAGEPSGTAGRPMLRQLQALGITFSAVVVVRYFGGTLLGKAGLVHAYAEAARLALANNVIVERVQLGELVIGCTYAQLEEVRTRVMRCGGEVRDASYADRCAMRVALPPGTIKDFTEHCERLGIAVTDDHRK